MNQKLNLQELFPGTVNQIPLGQGQDYYHISWYGEDYYIPNQDIDDAHRALLHTLATYQTHNNQEFYPSHDNEIWQDFLRGRGNPPSYQNPLDNLRLLHIKIYDTYGSMDDRVWQETLLAAQDFSSVLIKEEEDQYLLILQEGLLGVDSFDILQGIFQALDNDFGITSYLMLGNPFNIESYHGEPYHMERQLFQTLITNNQLENITDISQAILKMIAFQAQDILDKLPHLKDILQKEPDYRRLIEAIYKHNGNLSQTAEHLFIHRNTLAYRIDKFKQLSHLDLTQYSDLFLAYLLTLTK